MKFLLFIMIVIVHAGCSTKMELPKEKKAGNVSFNEVWSAVKSDLVEKYPHKKVSFFKLYHSGKNIIKKDSRRTLTDHRDIIEPFEKLAHPNGICLKGVWEIDTENIYSGYFKKGSQALIIARASTAMGNTKSGKIRSFGFAGKLFPTLNEQKVHEQSSANFFLIDDLGGTDAPRYTDVEMSNEPEVSLTVSVAKHIAYALKISSTFKKADSNLGIRQLYEISYLGEGDNKKIITPKWMKIKAVEFVKKEVRDFRDELSLEDSEKLVFHIFVANQKVDKKQDWKKIGRIIFDTSVVSKTCDQRLHFHHPRWRDDLDYGEQ